MRPTPIRTLNLQDRSSPGPFILRTLQPGTFTPRTFTPRPFAHHPRIIHPQDPPPQDASPPGHFNPRTLHSWTFYPKTLHPSPQDLSRLRIFYPQHPSHLRIFHPQDPSQLRTFSSPGHFSPRTLQLQDFHHQDHSPKHLPPPGLFNPRFLHPHDPSLAGVLTPGLLIARLFIHPPPP